MSFELCIFTKNYMNHLSRLLSMLTILKSKRIVTGTEFADKFGVSIRTIYRDINKLEDSGVPIITIEGRGYSILDDYHVAPIMFDEKEVNAIITAEQLITNSNDQSLINNFSNALTKIKSVFKSSLQSKGELLTKKMHIFSNADSEYKSDSLSEIQMAIINFRVVDINYEKENKIQSFRLIEPVAIYAQNDKWIVIAWCQLRNDFRAFRLDRIKNYRILEQEFEDRKFELRNYFLSCPEIDFQA